MLSLEDSENQCCIRVFNVEKCCPHNVLWHQSSIKQHGKIHKKDNAFLYLNVFRAIGYAIEVVSNTLNPVPTTVVPIVTRYDLTIVAACFTM